MDWMTSNFNWIYVISNYVNYYGQTLVPCDAFVGIVIVTPWAPILLCSINGNQMARKWSLKAPDNFLAQ